MPDCILVPFYETLWKVLPRLKNLRTLINVRSTASQDVMKLSKAGPPSLRVIICGGASQMLFISPSEQEFFISLRASQTAYCQLRHLFFHNAMRHGPLITTSQSVVGRLAIFAAKWDLFKCRSITWPSFCFLAVTSLPTNQHLTSTFSNIQHLCMTLQTPSNPIIPVWT